MVNAGDGIDLDVFLTRQPKDRMVRKLGQQLRINRSKIKETSDTNTDFDDLDGAIRSGYFLKDGLSNNEDFYYLNLLITVTAGSVDDLEWKVAEMKKLLLSQDMDVQTCSFCQEQAFLSSLPLVSLERQLYERSKRNVLTTGAASCYPFTSYEMCDDNGILLGVNKHNNSLIIVDIFDSRVYKNANILATMLTAEIDFIVRGLDNTARSVVASRKAAMLRKRQTFYLDTNEDGVPMIYEGRVVQARVIGVAEKVLRVEVFGVECTIFARDLSAAWFGDAREYYSVGDRVLVRVLTIDRDDINHISITADIRSVSSAANQSNLDKCVLQGKYAGRVTDVRHGVVFIRLNNGVNAVAHTCYDRRMPGKKDDVSFAVTRLDEERGIAVGIITRIIKQNL